MQKLQKLEPCRENYNMSMRAIISQYMIRNRYLIIFAFAMYSSGIYAQQYPGHHRRFTCTRGTHAMKVITYQCVPRRFGDIFEDRKNTETSFWRALSWTGFNVPLWCPSVSLRQLTTPRRAEAKAIASHTGSTSVNYKFWKQFFFFFHSSHNSPSWIFNPLQDIY